MAVKAELVLKLNRKGLDMDEIVNDDWEILIIILEELYEPEEIETELLTAFWYAWLYFSEMDLPSLCNFKIYSLEKLLCFIPN